MTLAFVPLYIRYLGIEAYGLVGMFAILLSVLGLLDMGMKPTLAREMARFTGGAHNEQSIWNLLRSIEIASCAVVIAAALTIWSISGWLATDWVQAQTLSPEVVSQAFTLMGLVAAIQFLESIYSSCLAGLQRQVLQNAVACAIATLRGFGAVGVLMWVAPTTQAFFVWQAMCSCLGLLIFAVAVYKSLPSPGSPARFSIAALASVWRFASGMLLISVLVLLLMQTDKVLLSRLLTLESFGYYTLASVVAGALWMLVAPIAAAYYPRFNQLVVMGDTVALRLAYHQSAQLVTVIVGSAAAVLFFFSEQILLLWTSNHELSHRVAPIMAVLALGTFLNCLMWVPYQMQLAYGWISLTVITNSIAVAMLVPAIFVMVPIYGPIAAAWIWVILNGSYCLIGIHFMYRRILKTEQWAWYCWDVMLPLTAAVTVVMTSKYAIASSIQTSGALGIFTLAFIVALTLASAAWCAPTLRARVRSITRLQSRCSI